MKMLHLVLTTQSKCFSRKYKNIFYFCAFQKTNTKYNNPKKYNQIYNMKNIFMLISQIIFVLQWIFFYWRNNEQI